MFSVPISVVLLVFFVSQGQTSSTTTLSVSPSPSSAVVLTSSPSPTEPTTTTSEQPTTPSEKTCAKLRVVINTPWNDTYKNSTSENFLALCDAYMNALRSLYKDSANNTYVKVSEVQFTEKEGKVLASAKLCLVKEGVIIENVFKEKVATGKLDTDLTVIKDSAEFEPLGVSFKDWKAKEGECEEKCEGAAGPFSIVKECEPDPGFSCDGLKEPTEETDDCAKYCSSTVAAVSVSFVILVIGIFLSSSFQ